MRLIAFGVLALLALSACEVKIPSLHLNDDSSRLPNIVILFADDLGYGDLGIFGHPYNRTPELDKLALEGQRWTDFYVASPVCSPSRGALLTGRLPIRTGLYGRSLGVYFPDEPGGIPQSEVTLAEALKQKGYATGIFGKWHLGDAKHAWPTGHGFDEWLGVPHSNDMNWAGEPSFEEMRAMNLRGENQETAQIRAGRVQKYQEPQAEYWNVPLIQSWVGGESRIETSTDQSLLTRRYTEAAKDFIRRNVDSPFLVYVPYTMPHTPLFPSNEFSGRSLGGRYGDVIEEIDWSVGEIRKILEDLEIADNTLIIFSSDNGPWLTMNMEGGSAGPLRGGKGTTFEGGVRVPTIFYWPGMIQPGVISEIGSTLDLFTTAISLAGITNQTGTDSVDLTSVLFGTGGSVREEMPYYRRGELYAYRVESWKLHFITEGADGQLPERTVHETPILINLSRDPSERFDLSADYPEIVQKIQSAVERHRAGLEMREPLFDSRIVELSN